MSDQSGMTYKGVGVDYDAMDPFKRACQLAGRETASNINRFVGGNFLTSWSFQEVEASRGESAYLIETPDCYLAHVEEGLGTKNLVADTVYALTGKSYYDQIGQDTVAMIVNDMITLGALPLSVAMHLAVGSSNWFADKKRSQDLVTGWQRACNLARCAWGGGETPTLKGVVLPEAVVLSGSAMGIVSQKESLIAAENIRHGDAIVLIGSSGIHANGLTMARKIADQLPDGYLTALSDGRLYGESLLDPTHIYVGLVEDCLKQYVDIHYLVNITGHGWRKLMRAPQPFHYHIYFAPNPHPVFELIQDKGKVELAEMYGNFNMGAGFAFYVPEDDVNTVLEVASHQGLTAVSAGPIQAADDKRVILHHCGLEYSGETLGVR